MLQSNFPVLPSNEPDQFSLIWPLQDQSFISEGFDIPLNDDHAFCISTYDSSSNSSDIDSFNFEELECNMPVSDTFVSSILGDDFPDIEYQIPGELRTMASNFFNNVIPEDVEPDKCSVLPFTKSWSRMSTDEQQSSLFSLSHIVCQMDINKQLEIIRIIDPDAHISSEMTEFKIDESLMTAAKWKRIQYIFKKHMESFSSQEASMKARETSKASKSFVRKSNFVSRASKKSKQKREISETNSIKCKRVKRRRKAEKSDFFVYEKIVKFTSLEEDEDVNILE